MGVNPKHLKSKARQEVVKLKRQVLDYKKREEEAKARAKEVKARTEKYKEKADDVMKHNEALTARLATMEENMARFTRPLCHNDESIALLQFKDSFVIDKFASYESSAYPKTASWCDEETGHVIALHRNSSCLHGSINSASTLFQLSQLQVLDLYDNDFNQSQIPSALADLSKLTYLDLEWSGFSGLFPSSIGCSFSDFSLLVCKLTSTTNLYISESYYLNGQMPSFLQKLNQLNTLDISSNNLSGQIPPWLGNLIQLTSLSLKRNNLQGILPKSFSRLKNIENLYLNFNHLSGTVDFDMFLGMKNLLSLGLSENKWSVLITETNSSTNGTSTVPQLYILLLSSCNLRNFPGFLRYQNNLMVLSLNGNQIEGKVPKWALNISLETMAALDLSRNFLSGFDQPPLAVLPWVRLHVLEIPITCWKDHSRFHHHPL
nr:receptor-like protein 6 [Ziziphus jujuba var. spinosa]